MMIRKHFSKLGRSAKEKIVWRSHEPTRIEAFSDSVFAFAISILIISLEVPKTSKDLFEQMLGFIPFSLCFFSIFKIWYEQYKFFRRYGMHDHTTISLNGILLFVVLFYIYPLKFLFSLIFMQGVYTVREQDVVALIIMYNAGIAAINYLFALMYYNAHVKRAQLNLTPIESFETRSFLYYNLYVAVVATLGLLATAFGQEYGGAGQALWGLMGGFGILRARRKKIFKQKFGNAPELEPQLGVEA